MIPANKIAPQAAFFRQYFPAPNSPGSRYVFSPAVALDNDKFDVKVSPRLTEKDSLVSRYSYANSTEVILQRIPLWASIRCVAGHKTSV
jgi:hypothetical protein